MAAARVKSTVLALSKMPRPRHSGRPNEDRPEPISVYQLKRGLWTCRCGAENPTTQTTCTKKLQGTPCGRSAPFVRVCTYFPIAIAIPFTDTVAQQGIDVTSGMVQAASAYVEARSSSSRGRLVRSK